MPKIICFFFLFHFLYGSYSPHLKEIAHLSNVKKNVFTGYGIVVGLSGTGDKRSPLTQKSLENFLQKQDFKIEKNKLSTRNSAIVSVVAETFDFLWKGDTVNVSVASLGDAQKINGGFLLPTALQASNGAKYILASGFIQTHSHTPTLGTILSGGIVEKNFKEENDSRIPQNLTNLLFIINDNNSSYLTDIQKKIEEAFPDAKVEIQDNKRFTIHKINKNPFNQGEVVKILNLKINTTPQAKIVIDKKTGVVIIGGDIPINPTHISFPYTAISISSTLQRKGNKFTSVNDLMQELNSINATTDEIVSVFLGLKKSQTINADLVLQ